MIHELQNLSFSSLLDMKINATSFWVVPTSIVLCTWSFPFKNNLLLEFNRQSGWFTTVQLPVLGKQLPLRRLQLQRSHVAGMCRFS